jgi:SAM-dependent methyltransferase
MEDSIKNIFENGNWYHTFQFHDTKSKGTYDFSKVINKIPFESFKNMSVLDVGCSDGYFSKYFIENLEAKEVTGVDFNSYDGSVNFDVISNLKEEQEKKHRSHNDYEKLKHAYVSLGLNSSNKFLLIKKIFNLNLNFKSGSIYDLSNISNHDIVFCGSLLEHLRNPITAIEELYFKTSKLCYIDVSNPYEKFKFLNLPILKYSGASGHFFRYSEKSVSLMMEKIGFKNVRVVSKYKIINQKHQTYTKHFVILGEK